MHNARVCLLTGPFYMNNQYVAVAFIDSKYISQFIYAYPCFHLAMREVNREGGCERAGGAINRNRTSSPSPPPPRPDIFPRSAGFSHAWRGEIQPMRGK
jgi:hypothetical protein